MLGSSLSVGSLRACTLGPCFSWRVTGGSLFLAVLTVVFTLEDWPLILGRTEGLLATFLALSFLLVWEEQGTPV